MSEKTKNILEWIECRVIAVVLALLIRYYVGTPTVVQQESMLPTLKPNERLILNRISRTLKETPERGDIITFEAPSTVLLTEEAIQESVIARYEHNITGIISKFNYYVLEDGKTSYIKRVIGLPGEHIKIEDGEVYINDEKFEENYLQPGVITDSGKGNCLDLVVPENCVFVMGDNISQSTVSRCFGCVPLEKIESKVWIRIWPLDKFGKIDK